MSADALFPFSNDYGFYGGSCDGNNPELYVEGTGVSSRVLGGVNSTVAVDLPTIAVKVRQGGTARSGYRVYASPNTTAIAPNPASTMEDCQESISRAGVGPGTNAGPVPAATSGSGQTSVNLPYGIWNVCIDNNNSGSPRRFIERFNNTPSGTPSPLAPTLISGVRSIDLNISAVSMTSSLCG